MLTGEELAWHFFIDDMIELKEYNFPGIKLVENGDLKWCSVFCLDQTGVPVNGNVLEVI